MSEVILSAKAWTAALAQPRRSKARVDALAAALPSTSAVKLYAGASLLRTITTAAWSVGAVQADGKYPLIPGAFTDPATGSGTPDSAVFVDNAGDAIFTVSAGVGSGTFRLASALTDSVPILPGSFVLLVQTDDIPAVEPPPDPEPVTNYVDTIIADMALFHDAPCDVLEFYSGWGSGATMPDSYAKPTNWTHGLMWFHVMETSSNISAGDLSKPWLTPAPYTGNQAPNTRIQIRDLQLWYLDTSDVWRLHGHTVRPGAYFPPISWGNESTALNNATWRDETSNGGGASCRDIGRGLYESHVWHSFTSPRTLPAYKALASCFIGRKILDNPNGADDRSACQVLGACAGDYYQSQAVADGSVPKTVGGNVSPMGFSRLKYFSNDWQLFSFYSIRTMSQAQVRANPPPYLALP